MKARFNLSLVNSPFLSKKKKKQILSFLHRPKTSLIYIKGAIVKKTSTDYKYLYDDNMHYMDALNPK